MNYTVARIKYPKSPRKREIYIFIRGEIVLYSVGGVVVYRKGKE